MAKRKRRPTIAVVAMMRTEAFMTAKALIHDAAGRLYQLAPKIERVDDKQLKRTLVKVERLLSRMVEFHGHGRRLGERND